MASQKRSPARGSPRKKKLKCDQLEINNNLDGQTTTAKDHPSEVLQKMAASWGMKVTDEDFARRLDKNDPLKHLRERFHYPKMKDLPGTSEEFTSPDEDCVYLCNNSLGLQPKAVRKYLDQELDKWAKTGVHGHFMGAMPWAECDECVDKQSAVLVGANRSEVAIMNGLTVNLHILLISFYRPTSKRHKILCEDHAFPSDHYTFESQIRLHGYDPKTSLLCIKPRKGENTIRMEDILATIEREGDSVALICFSGVQYYTGQLFDMETITKAGHKKGCVVGFDLAHAVGNVELSLHDWNVDFACWCTYKYLNSGAGGIAGAFIHDRHAINDYPKLLGWWGHKMDTRFQMSNEMDLAPGIAGYRLSNPSILQCASLLASLDVYMETSMKELRAKSTLLTGYLELLLKHYYPKHSENQEDPYVEIITPADPRWRGCQLSVMFSVPITRVFEKLTLRGVVLDKREPNVLRVAPSPLVNKFEDVHRFVGLLGESLQEATM